MSWYSLYLAPFSNALHPKSEFLEINKYSKQIFVRDRIISVSFWEKKYNNPADLNVWSL